jgi:hypothetical protein
MVGSPSATLLGCYAHGEKCVQKLDLHNMWRERWEGGETKHGGSKHMPTFVVVSKPLKPNMVNASMCQFFTYGARVDHFSTMI